MNYYTTGGLVSLVLFAMGMTAASLGLRLLLENPKSHSTRKMFAIFVSVFFWDFGYSWMGLCNGDDFAYVPRAIALLSVFMYMACAVQYVAILAGFSRNNLRVFQVVYAILSFISWSQIIRPGAVEFIETRWGYWYTSSMTWARIVQFVATIGALVLWYYILAFWRKHTEQKREKAMISRFMYFGPILFAGYIFDTLIPSVLHVAAVPGSAVSAFFSALLLYNISRKYRAFGISVTNVSEYVFNEVNVPVVVSDNQKKIVLCNDIVFRTLGHTFNDIKGETIEDLITPVADDDKTKKYTNEEIWLVKGTKIYCKLNSTDVFDDFGDLQYTITFIENVTETHNAMRSIDESREAAESANAAKSMFLANMSHEIRTPMNAIMGMSDILLQNKDLDSSVRDSLYNIKDAGEGLLGIINDVLDISKIEMGKYELIDDRYNLADLIHSASSVIKVKMAESALEYKLVVDPSLPSILVGDEQRVRQIIINILGNAVKFTKKGSITFDVSGKKMDGGIFLHMAVTDTGIGIKEEDIENIFGAFNQADTRKNRSIQGTGLGLAISKSLAKLMKGDITVESVYGEGSTFHITLFQRIGDSSEIGVNNARALMGDDYKIREKLDDFEYIQRPDKRILIVDDAKVNLIVAKGMMAPYGMQIDTASSGKEAIELIKANDYDLVFMDHMMPEMDGVDTTHAIRALDGDKYKSLVIVALTANAIGGTKEALMAEGMQDYISKPINKKELNDVIECWL